MHLLAVARRLVLHEVEVGLFQLLGARVDAKQALNSILGSVFLFVSKVADLLGGCLSLGFQQALQEGAAGHYAVVRAGLVVIREVIARET